MPKAEPEYSKAKDSPIGSADMREFIANESDFSFEMRVLERLGIEGFQCHHSGTYIDPFLSKPRQFDIRAYQQDGRVALGIAVECKNLRAANPLLICAVPRTEEESFHSLIRLHANPMLSSYCSVETRTLHHSIYKPGQQVGKATHQVRRDKNSNALTGGDKEVFEKVSQAISSSKDVAEKLTAAIPPSSLRAVLAVLVVPDGQLWQVEYNADGSVNRYPYHIERTTLFTDQEIVVPSRSGVFSENIRFRLSHLEILTFGALNGITDAWFSSGLFQTGASTQSA
ncbi:MAG TPA: hypothetical protein VHU83_24840 [Bryobacteraceae bacterium]|jgi:hypothetical protein|nr:hypothetical protein [Bryobacteraceae bacterium]